MEPEIIILSEITQTQKNSILCFLSFMRSGFEYMCIQMYKGQETRKRTTRLKEPILRSRRNKKGNGIRGT